VSADGGTERPGAEEEVARLRAEYEDAAAERERLRFELLEWRHRALKAEEANARWESWRSRRGWRVYMALLGWYARLLPGGSRRKALAATLVRASGPLRGRAARRAGETSSPDVRPVKKAIAFVSGSEGGSFRYRCRHQAEAVALAGATSAVMKVGTVDPDALIAQHRLVVLHRVAWSSEIERLMELARQRGVPVVFDSDDLVFDPSVAPFVSFERRNETGRTLFYDGLLRHRRTLERCDAATVSTEFLAERAREAQPRVEVVRNAVSQEMVALARAAREGPQRHSEEWVTLAYLSGTPTHDRDFREAAEAVLWALDRYPSVRFLLVGDVVMDERFQTFGKRVERQPARDWRALPALLRTVDVNLAPLEPENPFTESKSAVKYLEAALVAVPTIASPRGDFASLIEHGANGLLAEGPDEWRECIRRLVESRELRARLGAAAMDDVRLRHTTRSRSASFVRTLAGFCAARSGPLTVNWVLGRTTLANAGDCRVVAELVAQLAGRGHLERVYSNDLPREAPEPAFAELLAPEIETARTQGPADLMPADVAIATDALSAPVVAAHQESLFKCRLHQRPGALTGESEMEQRALHLPLRQICIGRELADEVAEATGLQADRIELVPGRGSPGLESRLLELCFVRLASAGAASAKKPEVDA
jgi:glycosyltransferase involved in cell wall biosynthesis